MNWKHVLVLTAALSALGAVGAQSNTVTLKALFMKQAAYSEADIQAMTSDFEKANPGLKVSLEFVPYEALHDKIVAAQGAGAAGYDVVLFDVIWPAEFSQNGFLQDVTARIPAAWSSQIFSGAWTTVSYGDKRFGMPWILDTMYLYYNADMLKKAGIKSPPKTWDELAKDAQLLKTKKIVQYPVVWSWSQAEALVCTYTTVISAYGGQFFDPQGNPAFQTGGGLKALQYMTDSLKKGLSNPHSTEYLEEDVRRVFSSGQAAFALNWTYMYNLANDPKQSKVAGKVGIVPAPGVKGLTQVSAMNGSMGLGISPTSQHQEEAWKYIVALTSRPVQEKYAKLSLPIWKASYTQPAVMKGQEPLIKAADKALNAMYPRPLTPRYQELSVALQKALQQALLGKATPQAALQDAATQAAKLK